MELYRSFLYIWAVIQIIASGMASLFIGALWDLRFEEAHTTSTALDPDPTLTRAEILSDSLVMVGKGIVVATVAAAVIFIFNYYCLEKVKVVNGGRFSRGIALCCWIVMFAAFLMLGIHCYLHYGPTAHS